MLTRNAVAVGAGDRELVVATQYAPCHDAVLIVLGPVKVKSSKIRLGVSGQGVQTQNSFPEDLDSGWFSGYQEQAICPAHVRTRHIRPVRLILRPISPNHCRRWPERRGFHPCRRLVSRTGELCRA